MEHHRLQPLLEALWRGRDDPPSAVPPRGSSGGGQHPGGGQQQLPAARAARKAVLQRLRVPLQMEDGTMVESELLFQQGSCNF